MIYKALLESQSNNDTLIDEDLINFDDNIDGFLDNRGRTIRWQRIDPEMNIIFDRNCCRKGDRILNEIEVSSALA